MKAGVVVIGVGNPYRRDDGVGVEVLGRVEAAGLGGVRCMESDGAPASLCDAWTGARLAVVVDAARSGSPPGTVHVTTIGDGSMPASAATPRGGSHALSIADAVALGEVLERLPQRLLIVGVEVGDVGDGPGLSQAVLAAVTPAADVVCAAVRAALGEVR